MKSDVEFYDIYDYIYVPFWKTKTFIVIVAFATAVIGLITAYFIINYIKKKNAQKKVLTSWEWALQELEGLEPQSYESKEEFKQFYFAITNIIKHYLKKRFSFDLFEKTDEELIKSLKSKKFDMNIVAQLDEVLKGSLLIKFANAQALREQTQKDLDTVIDIVKNTIPKN